MKTRLSKFFAILACLALSCGILFTVACGGEPASFALDKTAIELELGDETLLKATITGGGTISWKSSESSVATVSADGKVNAVGAGTAEITVTESEEGKTATCTVTVIIPVSEICLSDSSKQLYEGDVFNLSAEIVPDNATRKTIVWSSSVPAVATVSDNGTVSALSGGSAVIRATAYNGVYAQCDLSVLELPVLSVNKNVITVGVDEEETITAYLDGDEVAASELIWASSDDEIATVAAGKITPVSIGETTITISALEGRLNLRLLVKVVKRVESVSLNENSLIIVKGEKATLVATVNPADATNKEVRFSSSNEDIATVDGNGEIIAKETGSTIITVVTVDGEKTAQCEVSVYQPVSDISMSEPVVSVIVGEEHQIIATITPFDATNKNIIWTTDSTCISLSDSGIIKGLSKGQATVTATTEDGGKQISCTVNVIQQVSGIELDKDTVYMGIDDTVTLVATIIPENANNKNVSWSSAQPEYATVDEYGVVNGIAAGETVITATTEDGGYTASCTVIVLDISIPSLMAVGQSIDVNFDYQCTLKDGTALSVENGKITAVASGEATVSIVAGTFSKEFNVRVIDFGNTKGETFDLSTDLSLWQYRNYSEDEDVEITYENNVADNRATPYTFNALKYYRPQNDGEYRALTGNLIYLSPEIISLAKEVGYVGFTFTVLSIDEPADAHSTTLCVYNVNADGSLMWVKSNADPIVNKELQGKWTRFSFDLSNAKFFEGAGIGFGTYGQSLYLAKVEFFGADITEYASTFITDSGAGNTTVGKKSNDMVSEELIGKMFVPVSYTATLTYGEGGGKETAIGGNDYVKLTKDGYISTEYFTYNQIRISSEWIQAAKSLGYNVIGIYILDSTYGAFTRASYVKVGVDGKCYAANTAASGRWSTTTTGFVSLDISGFEAGESLVLCCSGSE
ncbi:MAG: Ig-like domain-containing protein, partial [Clostridia bacterium]|nr:Ig-like domain-containing protein [Clostridia bacterium]